MPDAATVRNPLFARLLVRMRRQEPPEQIEHRRALLDGLRGRVVDLGAGDGANFKHFPSTATEVIAIEPEPYLRARAQRNAQHAPVRVQLLDAVAENLPLEDASLDAAVTALVLCSVPDQHAALRELHRVIRPGGELRFYEHVLAREPRLARFKGSCSARASGRDSPAAAIRRAIPRAPSRRPASSWSAANASPSGRASSSRRFRHTSSAWRDEATSLQAVPAEDRSTKRPEPQEAAARPPGGRVQPAPPATGEPAGGRDPRDPGPPIIVRLDELILGDLGNARVDARLVTAIS
jgi:ubiquinone/menaquinone biosynthesis C-methylase UbiE